jgi:DNA-binding NtrC family response regulator
VRSIAAEFLAGEGVLIEEAANSAEALELLKTRAFDAVISDIVMPGALDGIGLAAEIGRRWPTLPVLLVSGFSPSLAEARAAGLSVLNKPYRLDQLLSAVRAMTEGVPTGQSKVRVAPVVVRE